MLNLTDLASRLAAHVREHRDASLAVHEQGVLDAWRAEAGAVLAGVVSAATTGADPQARPPRSTCPWCGLGCRAERGHRPAACRHAWVR